jgi:drug/metabolite transporter (DMT)-like permease
MARVAIGAATLWIFWRRGGAAFPLDSRALTCFAILGLVGIALPFALSTWGTQFIPSGLSAILNATMPLFTIILAAASGAEDLSWRRSAGVLCGFGGILLVTWPGLRGELGAGQAGQAAVVLAALCSAAGIVYARHKAAGLSPLALSTGQITAATLWLLPVIVAQRPWGPGPVWGGGGRGTGHRDPGHRRGLCALLPFVGRSGRHRRLLGDLYGADFRHLLGLGRARRTAHRRGLRGIRRHHYGVDDGQ